VAELLTRTSPGTTTTTVGGNASKTGYNMFSQKEWDDQVTTLIDKFNITNLGMFTPIFEAGVGGGAFLDSLRRLYGCEAVEGCDTASTCVDIAKRRLPWGNFWVGDACDLSCIPDASKMFTLMFGVRPYMNDEDDAERAVKELIRITKPGGWILVAENNHLGRKGLADSIRIRSHKLPSNHLFLPSWLPFGNDFQTLRWWTIVN
jgi:ubiquinone/menaquinone biosynthesis C-methylase UbiE